MRGAGEKGREEGGEQSQGTGDRNVDMAPLLSKSPRSCASPHTAGTPRPVSSASCHYKANVSNLVRKRILTMN